MVIGLSLAGWFLHSPGHNAVKDLANLIVDINFRFPFLHFVNRFNELLGYLPMSDFPDALGEMVVYLGIGGFVIALYQTIKHRQSPLWRIYLFLTIWTLVLFIGSQTKGLVFPARLARDLAIPLALLGGLFVQTGVDFMRARHIPKHFMVFFLLFCLTLGANTFSYRYRRAFHPNPLINHLTVDSRAASYITKSLPIKSKIIVFQDDIYLDDFTPIHKVEQIHDYDTVLKLTSLTDGQTILAKADYVYIEERFDRDRSWINNSGIPTTYINSPLTTLVASFEQPEKKVYIFKVKH